MKKQVKNLGYETNLIYEYVFTKIVFSTIRTFENLQWYIKKYSTQCEIFHKKYYFKYLGL